MPTLSKAKKETKLVFKWGGILLGIILVIFTIVKGVEIIKTLTSPPPPPEAGFGKIPAIAFPDQEKPSFTYNLDTVSGYLPTLPDRAKIFKVKSNPPTLLGLGNTKRKVEKIGFPPPEIKISDDTYRWVNLKDVYERNITINIFSSDFKLQSSYLSKAETLKSFANQYEIDSARETIRSFISDMSIDTGDINKDKTKLTLYSINGSSLSQTSKISETKILRVDYFQNDLDKLPIVYENGAFSTLNFFVGKNNTYGVLDATFYHKIASETNSTYAIKTAQEVYQKLEGNEAFIITKPSDVDVIIIKNVYLAYYIGENYQEYISPVVVFEGKDFLAYVSAVKDEWISK